MFINQCNNVINSLNTSTNQKEKCDGSVFKKTSLSTEENGGISTSISSLGFVLEQDVSYLNKISVIRGGGRTRTRCFLFKRDIRN